MKIQYISDIHLEFYKNEEIVKIIPSAPILCLCGDIGYPEDKKYDIFLEWSSKNYEKVFLITGNHEYYNKKKSIKEINDIIQTKVNLHSNITFLNNKIEEYHGYTFIGCILWSSIPFGIKRYELNQFNDFKKIKSMSIENYNILHLKDLLFLKRSLTDNKNIICLTHHLPSLELISEKYKDSDLNYMFASNLNYLITENIKLWICGHSHDGNTKIINEVICTLNPHGYPKENNNIEEIISKTIEI